MHTPSALHAHYLNPLDWAEAGMRSVSLEDGWAHVDASLRAIGFDKIGGTHALPIPVMMALPGDHQRVGTLVSKDYQSFHDDNPKVIVKDPYARLMAVSCNPVFYLPGHDHSIVTSEADDAYLDWSQAQFGARGGLGFPIRDRQRGVMHAISITTTPGDPEFGLLYDEFCEAIHRAATYFFEGIAVNDIRSSPDFRPLTSRERTCLTWCSVGKTTSEIADVLSISDATVNEHITNATKRLRASNRTHACARATLLDLINP